MQPSPKLVNPLVGLLCLLWGSTWWVIKEGLRDLPPFTSASLRFVVAGLVMAALAPLLGRAEGGARPAARVWVTLGVLNFALSYGIVYWTETRLPSGITAVLWGVFPMLMAACGHAFLPGERLHGVQWLGFVTGFSGVVLLFLTDLAKFDAGCIPAAAVLLISPVVSAVGTTVVKRHAADTNSVLLNRNSMLLGAALLGAVGLLGEGHAAIAWTPAALFSIAYLALCGTVLTFGIYFWLLRYAEAYKLGLIAYVTPVVALSIGWLGGETVTGHTVLGTVLILSGVLAVLRGKRAAPAVRARIEGDPA